MNGAPSCAVLGPGAEAVARRALTARRGASGARLLVRWGAASTGTVAPGWPLRLGRASAPRLPEGWSSHRSSRGVLVVDVPSGLPIAQAANEVSAVVRDWPEAVAVVVAVPRCDEVDRVLRMVDETVLVEGSLGVVTALAQQELAALGPVTVVAPPPPRLWLRAPSADVGQSTVVAVVLIAVLLAAAGGLGLVASALGRGAGMQGRADVAALAGAKVLADEQQRVLGLTGDAALSVADYRAAAISAVRRTARANRLHVHEVELLGDDELPVRVRVLATTPGADPDQSATRLRSVAEVVVAALPPTSPGAGEYTGPFAERQGQRMRPDVALAFDRMARAARGAGISLVITSAFRSDAEQAAIFARNPDPTWVAPPGKSLHRLGTELDLGPNSAWPWLAANAQRFGFLKRYSWEPWHYGYVRSAGSASLGYRPGGGGGERGAGSAVPAFVPAQYADLIARAAQRWSVGAALLGAQLRVESNFNPRAVSGAGAAGIAQFMPATAAEYGMTPAERFDPAKAINAQAHLMHDLLRRFGAVPLALAAYNAGPAPVLRCGCVPAIPETQAYVQRILALLGGTGLAAAGGVQIRLVE